MMERVGCHDGRVDGVHIVVSSGDSSGEEDQGSLVILFLMITEIRGMCLGLLVMAQG